MQATCPWPPDRPAFLRRSPLRLLASRARINGDVYYRLLEMAMGAEVNGKLVHITEESPNVTELRPREQTGTVGDENT